MVAQLSGLPHHQHRLILCFRLGQATRAVTIHMDILPQQMD